MSTPITPITPTDGPHHPRHTRLTWVVFGIGALLWLVFQGILVWQPLAVRSLPPEVDDSYGYLLKAAQLDDCFWQECPALNDLRHQVDTPIHADSGDDLYFLYEQVRAHVRLFLVYTPLFSIILWLLHHVGLSWEGAYTLIWALGPPLFGVAIALWVRAMWGWVTAGLVLGILAVVVFPEQGLHYVVPSNICLALAMLMWARLFARNGDAPFTLVIGTMVLVGLHTIGVIYALIAILFAAPLQLRNRKMRVAGLLAGGVVALSSILPTMISRPDMAIRPYPYPEGVSWQAEMMLNLHLAQQEWWSWVGLLAPLWWFGTLIILGGIIVSYALLYRQQRASFLPTLWLTILVVGATGASIFVVRPYFPASLFYRLWIPCAVMGVAAYMHMLWQMAVWLRREGTGQIVGVIALPILVVFLVLGFVQKVPTLFEMQAHMRNRHSFSLDPDQVAILVQRTTQHTTQHTTDTTRVFYRDEIPRDFYLTHSAMKAGAVYWPIAMPLIKGRKDVDEQLLPITHAVIWDPVETMALDDMLSYDIVNRDGELLLRSVEWMRIEIPQPLPRRDTPHQLKVWVRNDGKGDLLGVFPIGQDGSTLTDAGEWANVPGDWEGWLTFEVGHISSTTAWDFGLPRDGGDVALKGLVFDDSPLQWPWRQQATLRLNLRDIGNYIINFNPVASLPGEVRTSDVQVLDDSSATVLLELDTAE